MSIDRNRNVYKGHRYVPKIMDDWDKSKPYESLSIVTYQGTSYTSKKLVPAGVDINNKEYWAVTGNYNAQVEHYRQEVKDMKEDVKNKADRNNVAEGSGYGVIEGMEVLPQTWPIRNMNIQMTAGTVHMKNGDRFKFDAIAEIPIDLENPDLMRRDTIAVNLNGEVVVLKGVPSSGDAIPPGIPDGWVSLAVVAVRKGQTVIDSNVVQDRRYFKYNNNQIADKIQKARSNNALSIRNSDGAITKMFNYAQTYVKNVDKFSYGGTHPFKDQPLEVDESGRFRMNCSSYGHLLQKGIPYENSRYAGLRENILDPIFNDMIDVQPDWYSYGWAEWAHENGYGFVPEKGLKNVVAGDSIFFSWADPKAQLPKHSASFMNIDHNATFVEKNPDGSFIVYEDGVLPTLATYPASYMDQVVYVCRLPFTNVDLDVKNMAVSGDTKIVSTGKSVVNTYSLTENLENHKWYTVVIKGKIQTKGCWFNVYCGDTLLYTGKLHGIRDDDLYTFHFCTKDLDVSDNHIRVNLVAVSESDVPTSTRNAEIDWFVITKGFTNSIKNYVGHRSIKFTFNSGYTGIQHIYYDEKTCILNVRIQNAGTIADGALIDIGTITGVSMKESSNIPCSSLIALNELPSYSNDITAWVQSDSTGAIKLRLRNGNAPNKSYIDLAVTLPIK